MFAISALATAFAAPSPRTRALFDDDWKFHRGDASGASDPKFDDGAWRTLDVPHDWSAEDLPPRAADVLTVRNGTWSFQRGDDAQWSSPAFDDSAWDRVRVPSDWRVASNYTAKDAVGWYAARAILAQLCAILRNYFDGLSLTTTGTAARSTRRTRRWRRYLSW